MSNSCINLILSIFYFRVFKRYIRIISIYFCFFCKVKCTSSICYISIWCKFMTSLNDNVSIYFIFSTCSYSCRFKEFICIYLFVAINFYNRFVCTIFYKPKSFCIKSSLCTIFNSYCRFRKLTWYFNSCFFCCVFRCCKCTIF